MSKSESFSVCDTWGCPNRRRVASHPRSEKTPDRCGVCGFPVRIMKVKHRQSEEESSYEVPW